MKIHESVAQGTDQWRRLRAGLPTASEMHKIITPVGKRSEQRHRYMARLLVEKLTGNPIDDVPEGLFDVERGKNLEAEAIRKYEYIRDCDTRTVGFVTAADGKTGCSPDRLLIGARGSLEMKVPNPEIHMMYALGFGAVSKDHWVQVQGQLYVMDEIDFVDVMSYCPGLPDSLVRVERDEDFQDAMNDCIIDFLEAFDGHYARCVENGWLRPEGPSVEELAAQAVASGAKVPAL